MLFKYFAVIFSLFVCANAKSFTIVIDTTYSMQYEINTIRARIGSMINSIGNATSIENYILVPFNDPDVGPAQAHTTVGGFLDSVNSLRVSGGNDIPENSLSGLEKALQESKPESDIFLFTDACAKDEEKFMDIQRLCRVTRSKVIVFMSGSCSYSRTNEYGNMEMYYHVTKVCFGNVFQVDHNNYGQVFRFMKEIVRDDYNDVKAYESFTGYRELFFPADILTRDLIVAVTGDSPTLQLFEENGHSPRTEMLIETQHARVARIVEPRRGLYQAAVRCRGVTSVTIYTRNEFPLQVGFSPFSPESIEATSSKPLPGRDSFIFVLVPKGYNYKLSTLTIYVLHEDNQKTMSLTESGANARIYIARAYFKPGSKFRMTIDGIDGVTSEAVRMTSKSSETQTEATNVPWNTAVIESIIPESNLIDYKKNARVACKVTGCPRPAIWWENETGQRIEAEDDLLQYPATYISYVEVTNLTENITLTCKATTAKSLLAKAEAARSVQLFVYRPYVFQMVRTPEDTTIQYEEEGKLYCEVEAYPDPTIKWYFNEKEIQFSSNEIDTDDKNLLDFFKTDNKMDDDDKYLKEYFKEDNALVIKNMTSVYVGTYTCEAKNEANYKAFSVDVKISGLESPELEMDTELTSKLGESVQIWCRITKGKPNPKLTWQYKPVDGYEFTDLSDDIYVQEDKITINEVISKHKGTYKCEAVNEKGQVSREINVKVIYGPKIENAVTETKEVLRDSVTVLECNVDAEPKATVRWERSDFTSFPDDKHSVDGNSLKFVARLSDSGSYMCIAENEAGTANKTINVNVLVRPFITPYKESITVRTGSILKLPCNVEEANPPPSIEWKFIPKDSTPIRLFSGDSIFSNDLVFSRVKKSDAGAYVCFVENKVGLDRIEIDVLVE